MSEDIALQTVLAEKEVLAAESESLKDKEFIEIQAPFVFLSEMATEVDRVDKGGDVWLKAMVVEAGDPGTPLDQMYQSILRASERGANVQVIADYYTKAMPAERRRFDPFLSEKERRQRQMNYVLYREFMEAEKSGNFSFVYGRVPESVAGKVWTEIFPYGGRDHMKIYICGDNCAWIGGHNLENIDPSRIDCMVKLKDPKAIEALKEIYRSSKSGDLKDDAQYHLPNGRILLVDAGRQSGESLIYDHAVLSVQGARDYVHFVSQLPPDGILLDELIKKAKEGVRVEVVMSSHRDPFMAQFPFSSSYINFRRRIKGTGIEVYHKPAKVHMKYLGVDGSQALVGSHNLVTQGVNWKTAEIALHMSDHEDVQSMEIFYESVRDGAYDSNLAIR